MSRDEHSDPKKRRRVVHRGILAAAGALVPVVLVLLFWKASSAVLLLFAGYLVAVLLRSLAELVEERSRLSYRWSLATVLLLLVGLAVVAGLLLAPSIDRQVAQLSERIPQAVDRLFERLDDFEVVQWVKEQATASSEEGGNGGGGSSMLKPILGVFATTFGAVSGFLVILFTGIYLSISPGLYQRGLVVLAPPRHRERLAEVMSDAHETLRHWMMGKVIAMVIVGLLTWGGLLALGIPLAGTLALVAALLTFIPNFGPVASAVPPVLLALAENPQKALWVVLLFLGIQIVESYFITPYIQKKVIEMPPAMILISQVILSILFGFLGLLVATPLTAALIVIVRELYVEDVLESDPDGPASDDVVDSPEDGDDADHG